jgi:hypothetical protein
MGPARETLPAFFDLLRQGLRPWPAEPACQSACASFAKGGEFKALAFTLFPNTLNGA